MSYFSLPLLGLQQSLNIDFIMQCYTNAKPVILEPVMLVELKVPTEFQGSVTGDINKYVIILNL